MYMSAGPRLIVTVINVEGRDPIPDATVVITIDEKDVHLSDNTDGNGKKTFILT